MTDNEKGHEAYALEQLEKILADMVSSLGAITSRERHEKMVAAVHLTVDAVAKLSEK